MDHDPHRRLVNLIHDPIVTDTQSVEAFGSLKFHSLMGHRIIRQCLDAGQNASDEWLGQGVEVFLDGWLELEAIGGHACAAASSYPQG